MCGSAGLMCLPLTVTWSLRGSTQAGSDCTRWPLTRTTPDRRRSSDARREPTPASANTRWIRSPREASVNSCPATLVELAFLGQPWAAFERVLVMWDGIRFVLPALDRLRANKLVSLADGAQALNAQRPGIAQGLLP